MRYNGIAQLKAGDVVYECQSGMNLTVTLLTDACLVDDAIVFKAQDKGGRIIDYLCKDNAYCPNLCTEPEYVSNLDGQIVAIDCIDKSVIEVVMTKEQIAMLSSKAGYARPLHRRTIGNGRSYNQYCIEGGSTCLPNQNLIMKKSFNYNVVKVISEKYIGLTPIPLSTE